MESDYSCFITFKNYFYLFYIRVHLPIKTLYSTSTIINAVQTSFSGIGKLQNHPLTALAPTVQPKKGRPLAQARERPWLTIHYTTSSATTAPLATTSSASIGSPFR